MALIVGCGSSKSDDELVVYFVPSRDSKEIQSATQPLADMLKEELAKEGLCVENGEKLSEEELAKEGFEFNKIRVEVGTSFEVVGEALESGTAHVGFIPGGTYVLYVYKSYRSWSICRCFNFISNINRDGI